MAESKKASLSLQFTILGASITGLSSAIALASAGHRVLVLEKEIQLGGLSQVPDGGARLTPNGSRILYQWGLEEHVRAVSNKGYGFMIYKYQSDSDDYVGTHRWEEEMIQDAGADFVQLHQQDILQILYDAAVFRGAVVRFGTEVTSVDTDTHNIGLASGEVVTGSDVVVGADGVCGIVRRILLAENEQEDEADEQDGLAVYSAILPKSKVIQDPELAGFYDDTKKHMVTFFMGPERGAQALIVGHNEDLALWVYTKEHAEDGTWTQPAAHQVKDVVGLCNSKIRKLAALADTSTCVRMKNHVQLESWVSESGTALVVGEAAHPLPAVALHGYAVALEDGAFLGKLFANLTTRSQIGPFLQAFEDVRKNRCAYLDAGERMNLAMTTLPDGELQKTRDAIMRQNEALGRNAMDGDDLQKSKIGMELQTVFGYDAEDDAENWFVTWGRLREHSDEPPVAWDSPSTHI